MDNKRVGIVTTWFERGAAYVSKQFRQALEEGGLDVYLFARGGERYEKGNKHWDDEKVTWAKKTLLRDSSGIDLLNFKNWVIKNKISIVIFNEQRSWSPIIWCKNNNIKTVAYVDYYKENQLSWFGVYDVLICNTLRHLSVFEWHPGATYIPWGTNVDVFKPVERKTSNGPVFFHSAGYSPQRKGADILINAFSQLKNKTKLIIHCQINLYNHLPDLKDKIKNLVADGYLEIIEKTVSAPGLYHLGDVYVYPARLDGIGLTVCEALSSGLPVIVPDNPPMSEFAQDKSFSQKVKVEKYIARYDGYYWPQGVVSVQNLVEKMEFYIKNNDQIGLFKERAREYAVKKLDWNQNSKALSKAIIDLPRLSNKVDASEYPNESLSERIYRNVRVYLHAIINKAAK